jgi:hypothetical protein
MVTHGGYNMKHGFVFEEPHRKLTEKERDRMIDMLASGPLDYKPSIDNELMKLGLVQFWDGTKDAVEGTEKPFYAGNGRILPEWYDFKMVVK